MTQEEQKALDLSLWKEWTHKASTINCCKFCSAVVDDATAAEEHDSANHAAIADDPRPRISAGVPRPDGAVDTEQHLSGVVQHEIQA